MIDIFIPVLWICIGTSCDFMQDHNYYVKEDECWTSLSQHKEHMRKLVKDAGQEGTITVLEGTCADARIKARVETPTKAIKL